MAYCGPLGIPLSTFLSWDQADQDAALAWQARQAQRCPSCGWHPEEGPRHHHVEVCPSCSDRDRITSSDEFRSARGAHVVPAQGKAATCPTCLEDLADQLKYGRGR